MTAILNRWRCLKSKLLDVYWTTSLVVCKVRPDPSPWKTIGRATYGTPHPSPSPPASQLEHLTQRGNTRLLMNMERTRTHAAHWAASPIQRFILLLRGSFQMQKACKLWLADRWVQSYWKPFTCKFVWGWGRDRGRSGREGKPLFTSAGLRVYQEKETPLPPGCGAADVTHTSATDKERGCISVKRNVLWMCAALPL